jgi:DNA repair exonuclease SbcCD ATPase subunit
MKRISLVIAVISVFYINTAFSVPPADSLICDRNELYYQYLDVKNNTGTFLMSDCIKLSDILEQIVLCDNRLMDTLDAHDKILAAYRSNTETRNGEINQLKSDLDNEKTTNSYLFIALGVVFLLFLVFFILFLINTSAATKVRKQLLAEIIELNSKETGPLDEMDELEEQLMDKNAVIEQIQKENEKLESEIHEKDMRLTALQNEIIKKDLDFESKISQTNEKLSVFELDMPGIKQKLSEKDAVIEKILKEKELLESEVRDKDTHLTALQNEISTKSSDFEDKIAQINSKLTALENENPALQQELYEKQTALQNETLARNAIIIENENLLEDLRAELSELKSFNAKTGEILRERDQSIDRLQQELHILQGTLKEKERQLEEIRIRSVQEEEHIKKHLRQEEAKAKLEKLENLRSRNMLSDVEYLALKQRYEDELK